MLLIIALVGIMACDEDQDSLTNTTRATAVPPGLWITLTEFDVAREAILWSEADSALQTSTTTFYLREGTTFQIDSIVHDSLPDTNRVVVTSSAVMGLDGRVRSGTLEIIATRKWIDSVGQFNVLFSNWKIDDAILDGMCVLSGITLADSQTYSWTIDDIALRMTRPNQTISISDQSDILTLSQVSGTPGEWIADDSVKLDHVLSIGGTLGGYHSDGIYRATYSDSFQFNYRCPYPTVGNMIIAETGRAQATITIEPACTNTYQWQIGRNTTGTGDFK